MKNKEKFAESVLIFACDEGGFGVYKKTGEMERCTEMHCAKCLFDRRKGTCHTNRLKWLNSEYIEKPVISKRDRAFLEYLDKKYEYIARNNDTSLYAYNTKPSKSRILWKPKPCEQYLCFDCFIIDFPMVKWSDEEPWLIKDLKKLKVVENYE